MVAAMTAEKTGQPHNPKEALNSYRTLTGLLTGTLSDLSALNPKP